MTKVSMPSQTGGTGNGHPLLFGFEPAWMLDPWPDGGGYPLGFIERALPTLGCTDPHQILHVCAGSVRAKWTVDVREQTTPKVAADGTALPFADASFRWVMCDPPYSEQYAENLYDSRSKYPKPSALLAEASRVLKPGGRVGLLHFQVPMFRPPLSLVGVWGVSTGTGYAIRAWSVFEKRGGGGLL